VTSAFVRDPGIPADHPVTRLAAVFELWAEQAPVGVNQAPFVHVDVLDSIGRQHGSVDLTERQADRLAAALFGATFATHTANALAQQLHSSWGAMHGERPVARVRFSNWEVDPRALPAEILDLADRIEPATWYAALIHQDRLADCAHWLAGALDVLLLERSLLPAAPFHETDRVRVRVPEGRKPSAGAGETGETGTVEFVHVLAPDSPGASVGYLFEVRLDAGENRLLMLQRDEIEYA
jgi:hypothetical protein